MSYLSDIEIAHRCKMQPISEIAEAAGIDEKYVELYGRYKAKIDLSIMKENKRPDGKLILVTAITPTPAGEGKTTTTIGLADGLKRIGKNVMVALREPSLGPVFGIKGGAAGGGNASSRRAGGVRFLWRQLYRHRARFDDFTVGSGAAIFARRRFFGDSLLHTA